MSRSEEDAKAVSTRSGERKQLYCYLGGEEEWARKASKELQRVFPTPRDAVSYILDQFPFVKRRDEERFGEYRTKRPILETYDAMRGALRTGKPWRSHLSPEAHHAR